jgi:hypothetical protein
MVGHLPDTILFLADSSFPAHPPPLRRGARAPWHGLPGCSRNLPSATVAPAASAATLRSLLRSVPGDESRSGAVRCDPDPLSSGRAPTGAAEGCSHKGSTAANRAGGPGAGRAGGPGGPGAGRAARRPRRRPGGRPRRPRCRPGGRAAPAQGGRAARAGAADRTGHISAPPADGRGRAPPTVAAGSGAPAGPRDPPGTLDELACEPYGPLPGLSSPVSAWSGSSACVTETTSSALSGRSPTYDHPSCTYDATSW